MHRVKRRTRPDMVGFFFNKNMKKVFLIVGIVVGGFVLCVLAYVGLKRGYESYRKNTVVVPPSSGSPSFSADVDLENRDEVLSALRKLDTSENYEYANVSLGGNGLRGTPSIKTETGSQFIKFSVDGGRGPVVLKSPASFSIQEWIDPAGRLANCSPMFSFSGEWGDGGVASQFRSFSSSTKTGDLVLGKINNAPSGLYDLGILCDDASGKVRSVVQVYVHE